MLNKMKMQPMEWRKYANPISDKRLISKIYKIFIQLNSKKQITQITMGKGPVQPFFQRRRTNGQQGHEKVLNITNNQIKTNQNNKTLFTCQNGYYKKRKR